MSSDYFALKQCDPKTVCKIPHKDVIIPCRLSHVIDGDTICVVISINSHLLKISIRVLGIDAPESTKRSTKNELEIQAGLHVKAYVKRLVPDMFSVRIKDNDKYGGRFLGDVILPDGRCLGSHLTEIGYVKPYFGKKKEDWTDEELEKIIGSTY